MPRPRAERLVVDPWRTVGAALLMGVVHLNAALLAQQAVSTNGIGMEFVLIKPGEMTVGRYEPPYAQPASDPTGPGRGRGFSAEQVQGG